MGEWIAERNNEHLLSKNGLLDVAARSENSRKFTGISRINEAFAVHDKSLDGAKYKILLATRDKLLVLLRDVEDVLKDYTETEKVGVSRNGSTGGLIELPFACTIWRAFSPPSLLTGFCATDRPQHRTHPKPQPGC